MNSKKLTNFILGAMVLGVLAGYLVNLYGAGTTFPV